MELDFKIPPEDLLNNIRFLGSKYTIIDEDAGELFANRLVN